MAELSYPALEHAGTASSFVLQRTLEARLHEGFMVSHLRIHSSTKLVKPLGADDREREEERELRGVPGSVFQREASAAAAAEGPASHYAEVELSFPFADGAEVCRPASGPARPPAALSAAALRARRAGCGALDVRGRAAAPLARPLARRGAARAVRAAAPCMKRVSQCHASRAMLRVPRRHATRR